MKSEFSKAIGLNGLQVGWEVMRAAILAIRGMGAREAKAKLDEMGVVTKTVKGGQDEGVK